MPTKRKMATRPVRVVPVKNKDGVYEVKLTDRVTLWAFTHEEALTLAAKYNALIDAHVKGVPVYHAKYGEGAIKDANAYYFMLVFENLANSFTYRDALRYLTLTP